jgi:hypothetical protein
MLEEADIIEDAIKESVSGLMSEYRAQARVDGIVDEIIIAHCPIARLLERVNSRLYGLRSEIEIIPLGLDELRYHVSELGMKVSQTVVELRVNVPPPRQAHARPPVEDEALAHAKAATEAFASAVNEAVATHHKEGRKVVVERDGNLVHLAPSAVKKYRIINLASNAEWEADTSEQVWDIIGKEIPLFGIYEVRDNLTNEIVPEFIPL